MAPAPPPPHAGDAHDLGPALQPALLEVCGGRLSDIRWFRTDWQMGGAATAHARFIAEPTGPAREVVVKLPVGPREYRFTTLLAGCDAPTPRLAAHGRELGGYDLAWLVMERLPGNPMSAHLHRDVFQHLADAAARFYHHCARLAPLEPPPTAPDWSGLLERGRELIKANHTVPRAQEWINAIKHTARALPRLLGAWQAREINSWCHGDLHPGNGMTRPEGSHWGPPGCVLLDLAEMHCGHWVEDAVYLERLYWGKPQTLDGIKPVSLLAKARKAIGLGTNDDYAGLANIRRVLMAATSPAFLHREGHPAYLNAALDLLERTLPQYTR